MKIINQNASIKEIILEVAEVAKYLWQRGWAERNAGNISVNISHLITENINKLDDFPFSNLTIIMLNFQESTFC